MFKKVTISIVFIAGLVILFAFSPWVTEDFAENRGITSFQNKQKGIEDGCGFNCKDCGVVHSEKVLFGYRMEIEYACGQFIEDLKENHKTKNLFVSFLGTVH